MRAAFAMIGLSLLCAACAAAPQADPVQAECKQTAERDPQVKTLADRALGNPQLMVDLRADIKFAYQQALYACLRKHGVGPKGGVEPLRP